MTQFEAFEKFLEENNLTPEIVDAFWPYDYNDHKAYIVTHKGLKQYFYFREDGKLLQRKKLTQYD